MKRYLILLLTGLILFVSPASHAGIVLGAFGGRSSDTDQGIEKLKGPIFGGKIGYRFGFIALEAAHTSYNLEAEKGQAEDYFIQKAEVKGNINDLMLRFYPFSFISLVGGISDVNFEADIQLTNVDGNSGSSINEKGDTLYSHGSFFGGGIHIPLGYGFEIYGEYIQRKLSSVMDGSLGVEVPDLKLNEWRAGITWTWGSQSPTRKKKSNSKDEGYVF